MLPFVFIVVESRATVISSWTGTHVLFASFFAHVFYFFFTSMKSLALATHRSHLSQMYSLTWSIFIYDFMVCSILIVSMKCEYKLFNRYFLIVLILFSYIAFYSKQLSSSRKKTNIFITKWSDCLCLSIAYEKIIEEKSHHSYS